MACSGAWPGPEQLSVDIIFLETPHRLSTTRDLAAGAFVARWSSRPVRATSLAGLGHPVAVAEGALAQPRWQDMPVPVRYGQSDDHGPK